jgi:glycosyltransferase involved in cell wall biosynthesis
MYPLITVYLPTHNRKDLVPKAVNSVLAQDYDNFELIIVNDGSCDDTKAILDKFYGHNPKVRIIHLEEPKGACHARNVAIKYANGLLITGIDDDDEFLPHRLSTLFKSYDDKYAFICSGYIWNYGYKSRERFVSDREIELDDLLSINEATNQVLVKTSRVRNISGFDTALASCQDYDLWVRLVSHYGKARRVAGPTYIVNVGHGKQRISAKQNRLKGYSQFYKKHKTLMTSRNMTNQGFLRMMTNEESMSSVGLLEQIIAGHPILKLRYYISSNFKWLAAVRKRYLKRGIF